MANHLTPEELSKEVGIEREEVIRICIPKSTFRSTRARSSKTLFQAHLSAINALPQKH